MKLGLIIGATVGFLLSLFNGLDMEYVFGGLIVGFLISLPVMLVQGAIKQVQGQRLVPELNRHALDLMLSTSQPGTGSNPNV